MSTRESHPISDTDLEKWLGSAEKILTSIKGKEDLLTIFRDITPQEKYRSLPEELALFYAVRHATCLYFYFVDLLNERTGQRKEVEEARLRGIPVTPKIQTRAAFISAYAFFVTASAVVFRGEKSLRGKDQTSLAQLDASQFELVVGKGIERDLAFAFSYYVDALRKASVTGGALVHNPDDLTAISRDFWKAVASKAADTCKSLPPEFLRFVEHTTFRDGTFAVTGLVADDRQEAKVVSWARVQPEEIVGSKDVILTLTRACDRLALYDPTIQKNPFVELGGLFESALLDGPPGTGKTTLMRMMMTRIAMRAEQVGVPYLFKSVTADQVKSEWYGKTAQLVKELLAGVLDPSVLALLSVDDIDLLLQGDRNDPGTSGGDLDIMKALMDFFSGTGSSYTGNYLAVGATNKPTGTDDALRQRFVYRAVILGPETREDYADLAMLELRRFAKTGLLEISQGKYTPLKRALPTELADLYSSELTKKHGGKKNGSWDDIGALCEELHKRDPNFTGRPVKNALQVAVAQAADFEVPDEWFTNPAAFRTRPWEERLELVKKLYVPLTTDMILMALEHQFVTEARYRAEAHAKRVEELVEEVNVREEAARALGGKK